MASGGYWLCFTNVKVLFSMSICPCGHRRNFRIFAQNTSIFFYPLFANNAHFQLLLFANLDLNTFFASFIVVYTWSVYFHDSKKRASFNKFVCSSFLILSVISAFLPSHNTKADRVVFFLFSLKAQYLDAITKGAQSGLMFNVVQIGDMLNYVSKWITFVMLTPQSLL